MNPRHFSRALGRMVALGAVATLLNGCGILSWFHSTPSPNDSAAPRQRDG